MSPRIYGTPSTSALASFEVDELGPDPRAILAGVHPALVATRTSPSPAGFAWYGLGAPALPGVQQAAVVGRALCVLQSAAAAGDLVDFRIVTGAYLTDLARPVE
ncbi:hypothetical protein ACQQ2N_04740 [Dokdonella sp. MW10]|uniref:hypothetical protein n=1 Tax=Dokdonella sp. MW10 TaxID=2992926 RepID=UPI003F811F5F